MRTALFRWMLLAIAFLCFVDGTSLTKLESDLASWQDLLNIYALLSQDMNELEAEVAKFDDGLRGSIHSLMFAVMNQEKRVLKVNLASTWNMTVLLFAQIELYASAGERFMALKGFIETCNTRKKEGYIDHFWYWSLQYDRYNAFYHEITTVDAYLNIFSYNKIAS